MSGIGLQPPAQMEHKGRMFTLDHPDAIHWRIRDVSGLDYGTITVESASGESNDPVYNGHTPADDDPLLFGSDWDAIARGLINQYDADHAVT